MVVTQHSFLNGNEYNIGKLNWRWFVGSKWPNLRLLASYDKELNDLYRGFLKNSPHKELKKIEALWIRFKEADCDYIASEVHGGQYYDDVYKACLINKTKARIADLKRSFLYRGWFKDYRLSD